jgi:ADP-heptose:LPS heptosyltransferase
MTTAKKILVIRNDKIGDFMLSWPSFALLKRQYPGSEITALVPQYTASLAEKCEWIDNIIIDEREPSSLKDILDLSKKIKVARFDASISLFSETRTALALWLARVPLRIGPATKLAQIFLNRRLRQKRSRSAKPEYEYNLDLVKYYIELNADTAVAQQEPPFLYFDKAETSALRDHLAKDYSLSANTKIIIIHPGTGGSAINLSAEQYAELADRIAKKRDVYFVITAGPGELTIAKKLSSLINSAHHIHASDSGIIDFCKFLSIGDLFISGSTGPLHIAGALNLNTAAFYPARRSATALRWQTVNSPDKRLSFSPDNYTGENDMMRIDIAKSADTITDTFLS